VELDGLGGQARNGDGAAEAMFDEFERLRWFELPEVCLTPTWAG
jgi:hypothetical protein